MTTAPRPRREPGRSALLRVVGVVAVASVLRPPIAGVGPVIGPLQDDLGLSAAGVSALTALPVLCFGAGAFTGPALARRLGMDGALAAVLVLLTGGLLVRVLGGPGLLVAGTVAAGMAIAVANVLLPAVVKQDFPGRVGAMTGVYTATLTGAASFAALVAVPLLDWTGLGWRGSLGAWALVAAAAVLLWSPQVVGGGEGKAPAPATPHPARRLLTNGRAWAVTAFMGLQALGFYSFLTWLPSLLVDEGYSPSAAGALLSLGTVVGIPTALVVPARAARLEDQRWVTLATTVVIAGGFLGLLLAPGTGTVVWVVLLGLGLGAAFPLALLLVVLRSSTAEVTGQVSAMAQGVGYLFAAAGPFLVGAVHEASGAWEPALLLLLAAVAVQAAAGWVAGRAGHAA